jgi:hypothetical protein
MKDRHQSSPGPGGRRKATATFAVLGAAAIALTLLAAVPCRAASIPAWLDDSIMGWNDANPDVQITFVDIKDSFVWYMIPDTPTIGSQDIRERVYGIITENGYNRADDEELVTTGRPPTLAGPAGEKKCWRRSYVLDIEQLSNTTSAGYGRGQGERSGQRQRMLTSMVCADGPQWYAGFRILQ